MAGSGAGGGSRPRVMSYTRRYARGIDCVGGAQNTARNKQVRGCETTRQRGAANDGTTLNCCSLVLLPSCFPMALFTPPAVLPLSWAKPGVVHNNSNISTASTSKARRYLSSTSICRQPTETTCASLPASKDEIFKNYQVLLLLCTGTQIGGGKRRAPTTVSLDALLYSYCCSTAVLYHTRKRFMSTYA